MYHVHCSAANQNFIHHTIESSAIKTTLGHNNEHNEESFVDLLHKHNTFYHHFSTQILRQSILFSVRMQLVQCRRIFILWHFSPILEVRQLYELSLIVLLKYVWSKWVFVTETTVGMIGTSAVYVSLMRTNMASQVYLNLVLQ